MTFIVPRKELLDELTLLNTVVGKFNIVPALSSVMIGLVANELTLTTSDIDVIAESQITAMGDAWGGCVPCAQLLALVKLLDGDAITFLPKGNRLGVQVGKSKHLLPVLSASEFPEIFRVDATPLMLDFQLLRDAIGLTSFAMLEPRDETSANDFRFTGLSIRIKDGKCEVAATRKVVTAAKEYEAEGTFSAILPRGAVNTLLKLEGETLALSANSNHVQMVVGSRTIIARPLTGSFPQWRSFLPALPFDLKVDTEAFATAIKRASVTMGTDNAVGYEPMKLTIKSDELLVETRGGDKGSSLEPVSITSNLNGTTFVTGFIGNQVLGVLGKCDNQVIIKLAEPHQPLLFQSAGTDFVVMPIRLKEN